MANDKQFKLKTLYLATRGVAEYRATIEKWIKPTDFILEIGCEWGTTSRFIFEKCKNLIATDISQECIQRAKIKYPDVSFDTLDAYDIQKAMSYGMKFTKIYLDVSGMSGYKSVLDVIALLNMYSSIFEPELIVIKSGSLKQLTKQCITLVD
ncbi:MAG: class I SAM-dependent methyltransferase [bacterium]